MMPSTGRTAAICLAAALAAARPSPAPGAEPSGDESAWNGRISACIDARGRIGGHGKAGILWPGPEGTAFLGRTGLVIGFGGPDGGERTVLGLDAFVPREGLVEAVYREGCPGGTRFPYPGCDDDGDGVSDEDRPDLVDNDGDGRVDEDFGAVGHAMRVSCVEAKGHGLEVYQRAVCWNYGHVRDFIGFTTTIERPAGAERPDHSGLEAVIYVDFDVGPPGEHRRGGDDSFFMIGPGGGMAPSPAVSSPDGGMAALVMLSAVSKEGALPARGSIVPAASDPSVLLAYASRDPGEKLPGDAYPEMREAGGGISVSGAVIGDMAAAILIGPVRDLAAGESVTLDWAIVFGADERTLARNAGRALETWRGVETGENAVRWLVPARKAARIELDAAPAPAWVQGKRRLAAAIDLPSACEEEVEWLRVSGEIVESFEQVGGKIVTVIDGIAGDSPGGIEIEGQLTDGTLFNAVIGPDELEEFAGEGEIPPGRLPPGSIMLFPNPFETTLTIDVMVHEPSAFPESRGRYGGISSVRIYDVKGRVVRTVLEGETLHPGEYSFAWDGKDANGVEVAPGVYYCKLQTGERSLTKRVILLR